MAYVRHPASFRDPGGSIVSRDGALYRLVTEAARESYDRLMSSGLYASLVDRDLLVPHAEVPLDGTEPQGTYKVLRPEMIPFVSYPYEWSFSGLRDAALLTIAVQRAALEHEMTLKDASAFNVQFKGGRPVFIDTLSFESATPESPWLAYRQFCQHFLAPLAVMATRDIRLLALLRHHIDGLPLALATRLLPLRAKLRPALLMHLVLHAGSEKRHMRSDRVRSLQTFRMSRASLLGLLESLERAVRSLRAPIEATKWGSYYDETNYSAAAFEHKRRIVEEWVRRVGPGIVWDLGANTGEFSRIAAREGSFVVSVDSDPTAVERNYLERGREDSNVLALSIDLMNPSPSVGWASEERASFLARGPADLTLALALVHHLAITHNVPLSNVASFLAKTGRMVVVEFVPEDDSQVVRMMAQKITSCHEYSRERFERDFSKDFEIVGREPIRESSRVLYLLRRRED